MDSIGVAVAGTGFIGPVHVEALRRLGVNVVGILGSTGKKSRAAAESLTIGRGLLHVRRTAARRSRRGRAYYRSQSVSLRDGVASTTCGETRRLRKAAGDECPRIEPTGRVGRPIGARGSRRIQHSLLSTVPRGPRTDRQPGRGGRPARQRLLCSGLAAPRHRLQLACAGRRRRPAACSRWPISRSHWLDLVQVRG